MHHAHDAGGQVEFLARDILTIYQFGIGWRPILVEVLYTSSLIINRVHSHHSKIGERE